MSRPKTRLTSLALAACAALALGLLAACSGGGSMNSTSTPGTPSSQPLVPVTVNVGDAAADQVLAFELTINSIVLTTSSGTNVTVLSTPTRIELRHLAGTMVPIATVQVPAGTFTQATVTISNPEITFVNATTGAVVEQELNISNQAVVVHFAQPITLNAAAALNFDFNLAGSLTINGATVTFSPVITATMATVPPAPQQQIENGEIEVRGTVTAASGSSFTILVQQSAQNLTFKVDSNTRFEGVSGPTALTQGMVVEVHAVTQSDGSLLATKVEAEEQPEQQQQGLDVEGVVMSLTGSPATQFSLVVREVEGMSSSAPALGATLVVNLTGNTTFRIDNDDVDLSNLSFTPTFNASTLAKGQNVEVDATSGGVTSITAQRVRLKRQALTGTVSALVQNGSQATFTLTVPGTSAFAMLTGQTTVAVTRQPGTEVKTTLANGATVQVRGLLFFSAGSYKLVASRITNP